MDIENIKKLEKGLGYFIVFISTAGCLVSMFIMGYLPIYLDRVIDTYLEKASEQMSSLADKTELYVQGIDSITRELDNSLESMSTALNIISDSQEKNLNNLADLLNDAEEMLSSVSSSMNNMKDTMNSVSADLSLMSDKMRNIGNTFSSIGGEHFQSIGNDFQETALSFKQTSRKFQETADSFSKLNENTVELSASLENSAKLVRSSSRGFSEFRRTSEYINAIRNDIRTYSDKTKKTLSDISVSIRSNSDNIKSIKIPLLNRALQVLGAILFFAFIILMSIGINYIEDVKMFNVEQSRIEELREEVEKLRKELESIKQGKA